MIERFQMYLIVLALFVMYRNWEFYKILRGVTAKQIVVDLKKQIDESVEEVSAASEILPHWTVILSSSFSITFFLLVDVSYFALTIYFFRSPIFLAFTLICILWTLYLWPGGYDSDNPGWQIHGANQRRRSGVGEERLSLYPRHPGDCPGGGYLDNQMTVLPLIRHRRPYRPSNVASARFLGTFAGVFHDCRLPSPAKHRQ